MPIKKPLHLALLAILMCSVSSHAARNIDFCVELLREIHSPSLGDLVESKRSKFFRLVVGEENGRIVSSSTFTNPLETFEDVMGIQRAEPKVLSREERLEVSGGLLAPVPNLLVTLKKLHPILGLHDTKLRNSHVSGESREKHYNLDNATNAYIVFNDYHNSLTDSLRQMVIGCEALRKLIPQQDSKTSTQQFAKLQNNYESISRYLISTEAAAAHHIVQSTGIFENPYENFEDRMTPENLERLLKNRDFDRYLMTLFLYERIYTEIDTLKNDLKIQ